MRRAIACAALLALSACERSEPSPPASPAKAAPAQTLVPSTFEPSASFVARAAPLSKFALRSMSRQKRGSITSKFEGEGPGTLHAVGYRLCRSGIVLQPVYTRANRFDPLVADPWIVRSPAIPQIGRSISDPSGARLAVTESGATLEHAGRTARLEGPLTDLLTHSPYAEHGCYETGAWRAEGSGGPVVALEDGPGQRLIHIELDAEHAISVWLDLPALTEDGERWAFDLAEILANPRRHKARVFWEIRRASETDPVWTQWPAPEGELEVSTIGVGRTQIWRLELSELVPSPGYEGPTPRALIAQTRFARARRGGSAPTPAPPPP